MKLEKRDKGEGATALRTVRRWRFQAAQRAGIPIPFDALVPIRFRIRQG
jgi:hypothetical protein